jgi:hypothetical protein
MAFERIRNITPGYLLLPGFYVAESVKEKHFKKTAPFYLKKGVFWVIFQPL